MFRATGLTGHSAVGSAPGWGSGGREFKSHWPDKRDVRKNERCFCEYARTVQAL